MSKADELREALADMEHERWSGWMRYLFDLCEIHADGSVTIPANSANHWRRQIATPYADLSEREKDSDRKEVDKILNLLKPALAEAREEGRFERGEELAPECAEALHEAQRDSESWGRRGAFEEAAEVNARLATSTERLGGHPAVYAAAGALREAEDGIRLLADQSPPDSGWRKPGDVIPAVMAAHEGSPNRGLWIGRWGTGEVTVVDPLDLCDPENGLVAVRPVTSELERTSWPKKGEDT